MDAPPIESSLFPWQVRFASDSSLLLETHAPVSVATSLRVAELFRVVRQSLNADWRASHDVEFHPAYRSLLVEFDPTSIDPTRFRDELQRVLNESLSRSDVSSAKARSIEIQVDYGGDDGPDLFEVARLTGLAPAEVVRRHSEAEYVVGFIGFAPGFPYLIGLPKELRCSRKSSPRLKVNAGSVALAGEQTGIYPAASPGGWQVIGRTERVLFDERADSPSLLLPGDRVRFVPRRVSLEERGAQ